MGSGQSSQQNPFMANYSNNGIDFGPSTPAPNGLGMNAYQFRRAAHRMRGVDGKRPNHRYSDQFSATSSFNMYGGDGDVGNLPVVNTSGMPAPSETSEGFGTTDDMTVAPPAPVAGPVAGPVAEVERLERELERVQNLDPAVVGGEELHRQMVERVRQQLEAARREAAGGAGGVSETSPGVPVADAGALDATSVTENDAMGHMAAVGAAVDLATGMVDGDRNDAIPSAAARYNNPFVLPFMRSSQRGGASESVHSRKVYKNKHVGRNVLSTVSSDLSPFIMTGGTIASSDVDTLATTESANGGNVANDENSSSSSSDEKKIGNQLNTDSDTEVANAADKIAKKNKLNGAEETVGEADDDEDANESSVKEEVAKPAPSQSYKQSRPSVNDMERAVNAALDTSEVGESDYKLIKKRKRATKSRKH